MQTLGLRMQSFGYDLRAHWRRIAALIVTAVFGTGVLAMVRRRS
jgi:hypothetical protein